MLETALIVILTASLTVLLLAIYIRKTLPGILEDVAVGAGESISEGLKETFETPNMQRAMSILGQKSGEVRADAALQKKVAGAIVKKSPVLETALAQLGISPVEGLRILQDPMLGPMIQRFLGNWGKKAGQSQESTVGVM